MHHVKGKSYFREAGRRPPDKTFWEACQEWRHKSRCGSVHWCLMRRCCDNKLYAVTAFVVWMFLICITLLPILAIIQRSTHYKAKVSSQEKKSAQSASQDKSSFIHSFTGSREQLSVASAHQPTMHKSSCSSFWVQNCLQGQFSSTAGARGWTCNLCVKR